LTAQEKEAGLVGAETRLVHPIMRSAGTIRSRRILREDRTTFARSELFAV
jgi:hypothetical protein